MDASFNSWHMLDLDITCLPAGRDERYRNYLLFRVGHELFNVLGFGFAKFDVASFVSGGLATFMGVEMILAALFDKHFAFFSNADSFGYILSSF
jgi:hypothetical protein